MPLPQQPKKKAVPKATITANKWSFSMPSPQTAFEQSVPDGQFTVKLNDVGNMVGSWGPGLEDFGIGTDTVAKPVVDEYYMNVMKKDMQGLRIEVQNPMYREMIPKSALQREPSFKIVEEPWFVRRRGRAGKCSSCGMHNIAIVQIESGAFILHANVGGTAQAQGFLHRWRTASKEPSCIADWELVAPAPPVRLRRVPEGGYIMEDS